MTGWHWRVIALFSLVVPASRRVAWRREWQGELLHLERRLRARPDARSPHWRLFLRSLGAFTDASYLRLTAGVVWPPRILASWNPRTIAEAATQRLACLTMLFLPMKWVQSLSAVLAVHEFVVVLTFASGLTALDYWVARKFFKALQ